MYGYYSTLKGCMIENVDLNRLLFSAFLNAHVGDIWYRDKNGVRKICGYYNYKTDIYMEVK